MVVTDLNAKAQGRIIWQYRNGQKFRAWVAVLPTIAQEQIAGPANQVVNLINIDTARGQQLDICGRIAGIPERPRIRDDSLAVFAYRGTAGAQPYNVAPYTGPGVQPETLPLPNYLYRLVIKAKIIKNTSPATVDDVKRGIEFILGPEYSVTIVDLQNMAMRVILNRELPFNVRTLLELYDLVPRPQGVGVEYVTAGNIFSQSGEVGGDALNTVPLAGAM